MKKKFIKVLNCIIFIVCFLFALSSFFCILSFTIIDQLVYENSIVMIAVFFIGIVVSAIIGHLLSHVLMVLRLPVKEWKSHLLK